MFGKASPHGRRAYYGDFYMRSSYEVKFAFFLDCSGIEWEYEPIVFDLGNSTYTPDFYIPQWDLYVEIKGWWRDRARKKFELFRQVYPNRTIKVLMKPELQELGII